MLGIRRHGLVLLGMVCGLTGCASVQNDALPKSFIVGKDPSDAERIDRWREVVKKESACPDTTAEPRVEFDETGLPTPDEKALCKVRKAVKVRHEVRALLKATSANSVDCSEEGPCLAREYADEWRALDLLSSNKRPEFGVALSGGGPRSASFSIGVLKALYEQGFLAKTQYLSTVSGGGYAAYWYFSQLGNPDVWKKEGQTPFSDCYHGATTSGYREHDEVLKNARCKKKDLCREGHEKLFPFQAHLSRHSDLLTSADGPISSHLLEYAWYFYPVAGAVAYPPFPTNFWLPGFLLAIPHHLANTVMDWSWNGSFHGVLYRQGIHRTYGFLLPAKDAKAAEDAEDAEDAKDAKAAEDAKAAGDAGDAKDECAKDDEVAKDEVAKDAKMPEGCQEGWDQLGRKAGGSDCLSYWPSHGKDGKSLEELTSNYWSKRKSESQGSADDNDNRPYPVWVINTQGVPANTLWNACFRDSERRLADHSYEFTPFGYGSGLMGYFARENDAVSPGEKGPGPRLIPPGFVEPVSAVHASGAAVDSAGLSSKRQQCLFRLIEQVGNFSLGLKLSNPVFEEGHRKMHRLMPWPLYYFDGESDSPKSTEIYLSDGGHIDNLGLFSLIRRGVKTIVVFDASQDERGVFDDLRKTSERLKEEGIGVRLHGLCWRDDRKASPCASDASYVLVCPDKKSEARDVFKPRAACRQIFVGDYFLLATESPTEDLGKIVYIKSSLPEGWKTDPCDVRAEKHFPCATKGYLLAPRKGDDFPNTPTARIATDSNDKLFRAYRDLGTYLGHRAAVCANRVSGNPKLLSCDSADDTGRADRER